ncbi:MAG: hypothetical protein HYV09_28845 [Deltaproteobacteria bacterium]|nr:hypothetical protein [Deltaproteobacteria bacterium]
MRVAPALVLLLAVVGCERTPSGGPAPVEIAEPALRADESILDARPDGSVADARHGGATLLAREIPPRPDGDGVRQLVARKQIGAREIALGTVSDAKLIDRATVVVRTDGTLERVDDDGAVRTLDKQAFGPISVRNGKVAYVRGEMPELEVALADVERGAPIALTAGFAPAWCPAIADDGSVVFVSARKSATELVRARVGEEPRTLGLWTDSPPPLPEGPFAPIVAGDRLIFESGDGLAVLSLDGVLRKTIPGLRAPVLRGDRVMLRGEAGLRTMSVAEVLAP